MNRDKLPSKVFTDVRAAYSRRDTMLYALGGGAATDPLDTQELR